MAKLPSLTAASIAKLASDSKFEAIATFLKFPALVLFNCSPFQYITFIPTVFYLD